MSNPIASPNRPRYAYWLLFGAACLTIMQIVWAIRVLQLPGDLAGQVIAQKRGDDTGFITAPENALAGEQAVEIRGEAAAGRCPVDDACNHSADRLIGFRRSRIVQRAQLGQCAAFALYPVTLRIDFRAKAVDLVTPRVIAPVTLNALLSQGDLISQQLCKYQQENRKSAEFFHRVNT